MKITFNLMVCMGLMQMALHAQSRIDLNHDYFGLGAALSIQDELGNDYLKMEPSVFGSGGFFSVYRSALNRGFTYDGNYFGSGYPIINLAGANPISFNLSTTGDYSVILPTGAISDVERIDEVGVVNKVEGLVETTLNGTGYTRISTITLNAPAAGYALVIAGAQLTHHHTNGAKGDLLLAISTDPFLISSSTTVKANYYHDIYSQTGNFAIPASLQGIYPVTAGANTFYWLGIEVSGDFTIHDKNFTAVYVSTNYGLTNTNFTGNMDHKELINGQSINSSKAMLELNRQLSIQANDERIAREAAVLKAMIDQLGVPSNAPSTDAKR